MKDLNIPSIDEIQEETATSTDYYGEQRINAKGYTLVDCLSIDKDTNEVRGKCKLKPYKSYFVFEVREKNN